MIIGKKIRLRALEPSDIDRLYEWENNAEVWKISNTIQPFSRFALEQYISSVQDIYSQRQVRFIIETIKTNTAIGCIDLFDFEPTHRRVGLGILIAKSQDRNNGFGEEALTLILDYCSAILDCHQVYCNVLTDNKISLNIFKKLGFNSVGIKKDWIKIDKEMHDEVLLQKILN